MPCGIDSVSTVPGPPRPSRVRMRAAAASARSAGVAPRKLARNVTTGRLKTTAVRASAAGCGVEAAAEGPVGARRVAQRANSHRNARGLRRAAEVMAAEFAIPAVSMSPWLRWSSSTASPSSRPRTRGGWSYRARTGASSPRTTPPGTACVPRCSTTPGSGWTRPAWRASPTSKPSALRRPRWTIAAPASATGRTRWRRE